jgi:hypothetical protein
MKKVNGMFLVVIFGLSNVSQAMIAPWYMQIRQIDAAVEAVAERFKIDESDALLLSDIQEREDDSFLVSTDKQACVVELVSSIMKSHNGKPIAGAPSVTGKVISCEAHSVAMPTKSYEKISAKMSKAAAIGKFITGVHISPKGTIKLIYKTKDN